MLIFNKKLLVFFIFILGPHIIWSQACNLSISGIITDESTGERLEFANLFIEELHIGNSTNELGEFEIKPLCQGEYHLRYSHIGCETERIFLELTSDTILQLQLHHHAELLSEVLIHEDNPNLGNGISNSIAKEKITATAYKPLSEIISNIQGVSTLKSGSGVSKPIIHGLSGNRITILNNGIAQSGQQWGNDHAPEIDPFIADHISVVKGSNALQYGSNAIGGLVLVEPETIHDEPHLHGKTNYYFQTNGRGHTLNTQLEQKNKWIGWRIIGTYKRSGDKSTPNYYLTNTSSSESNVAIQLEKKLTKKIISNLYYSYFNTNIGILRGAHIGNLTDLNQAIDRDVPFYTNDEFSYQINAPKQSVQHHLLKWQNKYLIDDNRSIKFTYAGQINNRKEFDVRRGDRSDTPALSLLQTNQFLESIYLHNFDQNWLLKTGVQYKYVDNTNNPETGVLPLIPDYNQFIGSGFAIIEKNKASWKADFGYRFDYSHLNVLSISKTLPRRIIHSTHNFKEHGLSGSLKYESNEHLNQHINISYNERAPAINELYSYGLHQGVSGIERGDQQLQSEFSFKGIYSIDLNLFEQLFIQSTTYFQQIDNFIYLEPQDENELTIRGAFPVFEYKQTNAQIFGTDFMLNYAPISPLNINIKYAWLNGENTSQNVPLINMPSNNISSKIKYTFKDLGKTSNTGLFVTGKYIFKQNHLVEGQEIVDSPDAYYLFNIGFSTKWNWDHSNLGISISIENLLNTSYRDYLNRQRYFADETGRDIGLRLQYDF